MKTLLYIALSFVMIQLTRGHWIAYVFGGFIVVLIVCELIKQFKTLSK